MTKKYITQVSSSELEKMMKAGNIEPGVGINIERTENGLKISIDQYALKLMLWAWAYHSAMTTQSGGYVVPAVSLSNIGAVSLDPS